MEIEKKIAVLGWGSLIRNPEGLKLLPGEKWKKDGPCLPIEFARISGGKRVTLVLFDGYVYDADSWVRVYWNYINLPVKDAIINLMRREGSEYKRIVGYVTQKNCNGRIPIVIETVRKWMVMKGLSSVIWTDLRPKLYKSKEIIEYIKNLEIEDRDNTKKYIEETPPQIYTPLREKIEKILSTEKINDWKEYIE